MSAPATRQVKCIPNGNNSKSQTFTVSAAKAANASAAAAVPAVAAASAAAVAAAPVKSSAAPEAEGAAKPAPLAASEGEADAELSKSIQVMKGFAVKIAPFATIIANAKADTPMDDINRAAVEFNKVLAEFNTKSKGDMPLLPDTVTAGNLEDHTRRVFLRI